MRSVAISAVGLLLLLSWSCIALWGNEWQMEAYAHGPVVAVVVVYLWWRATQSDHEGTAWRGGQPPAAAVALTVGAVAYVLGRSQQIGYLHVPGLWLMAVGNLLWLGGWQAIRQFGVPLVLLALMTPVPTPILEIVTGPMRHWTTVAANQFLEWAGYPVAREGNTLFVGQYRLLVSEACSGLNSAFSLLTVVVVYLGLSAGRGWARSVVLAVVALPVSLVANVARVVMLAAITFHFGEAAGQGYLHGTTGYVMYVVGIVSVLALEAGWMRWIGRSG